MSIINSLPKKPSSCYTHKIGSILISTSANVSNDFLPSGQSFDVTEYPEFAKLYPNGIAPTVSTPIEGLIVYIKAR